MCGILLLDGPEARSRMGRCLSRLKHRGPDGTTIWADGRTAIGFNRLAINDKGIAGQQPFTHGQLVGAINGEIYNYRELIEQHHLSIEGSCDTRVVLPLFELVGDRIVDAVDGFYAGLIFDLRSQRLYCFRDHIGKKPLLVGVSGSELFITSELKALKHVSWFKVIPKGFSRIDLVDRSIELIRGHKHSQTSRSLKVVVEKAVAKRLPNEDEPLGLFLSGGLDSSLVAALVARDRPDTVFYSLAADGSPDDSFSRRVAEALELVNVRTVAPPSYDALPDLIEKVVYATESFNPSIVSNGLCTYLLAEAAHADGIKVVLTGEGADELFCGYHQFAEDAPWRQTRKRLIADMHFTELRRLDSSSMAHAIEARCPFLDREVRSYSDGLDYEDFYQESDEGRQNKVALRRAFRDVLPVDVLQRRKTSFDVGSGVRGGFVSYLRRRRRSEQDELEEIWRRLFGYDASDPFFHSYPVFDHVIATRGATHR